MINLYAHFSVFVSQTLSGQSARPLRTTANRDSYAFRRPTAVSGVTQIKLTYDFIFPPPRYRFSIMLEMKWAISLQEFVLWHPSNCYEYQVTAHDHFRRNKQAAVGFNKGLIRSEMI